MKSPGPILLVLVVSVPGFRLPAQTVEFAGESINVRIHDSTCELEGVYTFRNSGPSPADRAIFYPLLRTGDLPYPDSVAVMDDVTGDRMHFEPAREGILFHLEVRPERPRRIRIWYRQQTPARRFEYILTTTRSWGKPLDRAEFHIQIPESLRLLSCSPPCDTREQVDRVTVYHVLKRNFMPVSNLAITWKRRTR